MNPEFEKKIEEKMAGLPVEIFAALKSFDWHTAMQSVSDKHKLYIDQLEDLYEESLGIMLGLTDPEDFAYDIEDKLVVSKEKAAEIVRDLNDNVFEPIHKYIRSSAEQKSGLAQSGVEITSQTPVPMPAGMPEESQKDILSGIENPPASKSISFVEKKMSEPHAITPPPAPTSSPIPMPPGEKYADPYREEVN